MYVCICKAVSHLEIEEAVSRGDVSTISCLRKCLGVGTGCGTCLEFARECLTDMLGQDLPVGAAPHQDATLKVAVPGAPV